MYWRCGSSVPSRKKYVVVEMWFISSQEDNIVVVEMWFNSS